MTRRPSLIILVHALSCALACACTSGSTTSSSTAAGEPMTTPPDKAGDEAGDKTAGTPPVAPVEPPPRQGDGGDAGLEAAKNHCQDVLAAERPQATIEVRVLDGPGGTKIVRARDPKAYPGSGVCATIYDPGTQTSYGKNGDKNIALLIQERGWHDPRLDDAQLIKLVHEAEFNGLLMLKNAAVETSDDGGLRVRLPAHNMRGALQRTWIVDLPRQGEGSVTSTKP